MIKHDNAILPNNKYGANEAGGEQRGETGEGRYQKEQIFERQVWT